MNRINFPAFLLCVALSTGAAFAGSKFTGNGHVWITKNADGSGSGSGYLGMIYNGPDNEWIGCQKSSTNLVMCHAKNTDQLIVDCWRIIALRAAGNVNWGADATPGAIATAAPIATGPIAPGSAAARPPMSHRRG